MVGIGTKGRWDPSYQTRGRSFKVSGVSIAECPVSFITPRSQELLQVYVRSGLLLESSGASLFGPDISAWPAWAADAFETLEGERLRYENARYEAEREESE